MQFAPWILALVQPVISRILVALGLAVVTTVGFTTVVGEIKALLIAKFYALPADMLGVFLLAGGGEALGMIFGAIALRLVINGASATTRRLSANPG